MSSFGKLVANSYEFIQSHVLFSYDLLMPQWGLCLECRFMFSLGFFYLKWHIFVCFGKLVMNLYNFICTFTYDLLTSHWVFFLRGAGQQFFNKKLYVFIRIGKLVANSCEFVHPHSYVFGWPAQVPLRDRFRLWMQVGWNGGSAVTSQHEGPWFRVRFTGSLPSSGGFLRELWFPLQSNYMQVRWIGYS